MTPLISARFETWWTWWILELISGMFVTCSHLVSAGTPGTSGESLGTFSQNSGTSAWIPGTSAGTLGTFGWIPETCEGRFVIFAMTPVILSHLDWTSWFGRLRLGRRYLWSCPAAGRSVCRCPQEKLWSSWLSPAPIPLQKCFSKKDSSTAKYKLLYASNVNLLRLKLSEMHTLKMKECKNLRC